MPWSSSQQGLSPGSSFSRQDFVRRDRGLCARDQLLLPGETVLVMVSGGQDSLALLHLLASGELGEVAGGDVQVLHVNHALRGDDSEADEKLSYTHLRAHETKANLVCRLLLEKKK